MCICEMRVRVSFIIWMRVLFGKFFVLINEVRKIIVEFFLIGLLCLVNRNCKYNGVYLY